MAKSAPRLGKGLSAIVAKRSSETVKPAPLPAVVSPVLDDKPNEIPVTEIRPNARQPRTVFADEALNELAESIKLHGVMQPIVVRKVDDAYELIAGERRWRASQRAGLKRIPAIVRECSDAEAFELALVENLQREDLNPIERARAYRQYMDEMHATTDELASRLSQSRSNVANYIRLLNLAGEIQDMVVRGELSMGHARAIAGVDDPQRQLALAKLSIRRNLSVRQIEEMLRQPAETQRQAAAKVESDGAAKHFADVEHMLSRALGLSVKLKAGRKKNAGRIVIHYKSLDEFDRVAERLGGRPTVE